MGDDYQEIYGLQDPRTWNVRYIGISGNALRRYRQHIAASHSVQVQAWIASLERIRLAPGVIVIDEAFSHQDGLDKEAFWIEWFVRHGAPLLNRQQPSLPQKKKIKIFEGLSSHRWNGLNRSMEVLAQGVVSGRFETVSYKDLAVIEWNLLHMADYESLMLTAAGLDHGHKAFLEQKSRESERRFGVSLRDDLDACRNGS